MKNEICEKNNKDYYIGLDVGTDSVGYAVTYENYELIKHKGEPMWGTTVFEGAATCEERRGFRTARRRLNRRQQRVHLIQELFAPEIKKIDPEFFIRIQESHLFSEDKTTSNEYDFLKDYTKNGKKYSEIYPTIHHLIYELMNSTETHDVRLVYIACAWLVAHRGHFLNEVSKDNIKNIIDFAPVYENFISHFTMNGFEEPWECDEKAFSLVLRRKCSITTKEKEFFELLFNGKKPKNEITDTMPYSKASLIKLICGGKISPKDLFEKEEYSELSSFSLSMPDEELSEVLSKLDSDAEIIIKLKALYDWAILSDILQGYDSISKSKIAVYDQHKEDLKNLKKFVKKYIPNKYNEIFREVSSKDNYSAYAAHADKKNSAAMHKINKEKFSDYLKKIVKDIDVDEEDKDFFEDMTERVSLNAFLPKQVNGDNRVIPYQLYWYELKELLDKAENYLPFLAVKDPDGLSVSEKILSVFEFRIPYFVGPLTSDKKSDFCWMERKAEEKIYPWNFDKVVDLDASEEAFIKRMTNTCTYMPGEYVLPKNSLVYSKFEVLNEINTIKINEVPISVENKQKIYNELFMRNFKVSPAKLRNFMVSNGICEKDSPISGIDMSGSIKSTLKPYLDFNQLIETGKLTCEQVESYITHSTYSEDKLRLRKWVDEKFSFLDNSEKKYISKLKYKNFGRLSFAFLCQLNGVNKDTGETGNIMYFLWNTNDNLMQILSERYTFAEEIERIKTEYYTGKSRSLNDILDEMYISNSVKRPIMRTLDILNDVHKAMGYAPKKVFIEMARGAAKDEKNKRKSSRREQIIELLKKVKTEDTALLSKQLDEMGEMADNRLQSDALFLYFMQLGKCMYSGKTLEIEKLKTTVYNIDHIYPQSYVKDDSVLNNKVLVYSEENSAKSDIYPLPSQWRSNMSGFWHMLKTNNLITEEKYKRLIRSTPFTEDEKLGFINRQLVETRQSTKALAEIIKTKFPESEIVYVKAGLVSEFKKNSDIIKCRSINDLHHAKDAYLNIAVGNVYNERFTKKFNFDKKYSLNYRIVFGTELRRGEKLIWAGKNDIAKIKKIANKNNIHYTRFSFCRKGGLFDQQPIKATEGLVPLKKGLDTKKYGGYQKSTASFFALVKYTTEKKSDIMIMPVELMHSKKFSSDSTFANQYAIDTISTITGKSVSRVEFPLGHRILKVNTVFSLDGFKMALGSKDSGGINVGLIPLVSLLLDEKDEKYIKSLERFIEKKQDNPKILIDGEHDGITAEKNKELYKVFLNKLSQKPFSLIPNCQYETLKNGYEKFVNLSVEEQTIVLLNILYLFKTGRTKASDLSLIRGSKNSGKTRLSSNVSNWKKSYSDVRIIDTSASGIHTKQSVNLFDLL